MSLLSCISKQNQDRDGGPSNLNKVDDNAPKKPADPRIPLNSRQIFLLTRNWKGISRKMEQTGVTMFVRLFENNSDLYDNFANLKHLKDKDREELMNSEALETHSTAVMNLFDEAINKLENGDAFFRALRDSAQLHAVKPGFKPDLFWHMEEPFLYAVKLILDDRYTENMDSIYKTAIHLILGTMVTECEKATGKSGPS